MKETREICEQHLHDRISSMKRLIKSAESCLKDGDCLQCAVRLEEAAKDGCFDETMMSIFESVSGV